MARVFNGVTYHSSAEMVDLRGGSVAMWRHYARTNKVPASRWIDGHWYFNLEQVDNALRVNGYNTNETGNTANS